MIGIKSKMKEITTANRTNTGCKSYRNFICYKVECIEVLADPLLIGLSIELLINDQRYSGNK
jgi:hypothetical protein